MNLPEEEIAQHLMEVVRRCMVVVNGLQSGFLSSGGEGTEFTSESAMSELESAEHSLDKALVALDEMPSGHSQRRRGSIGGGERGREP